MGNDPTDGESPEPPSFPQDELDALFPAQRALSSLLLKPLPRRVYHYTAKGSGLAILRSSAVWASHIRSLPRDPDEYETGLRFVERRIVEMMANETDAYVFDLIGRWGAQWPRIKAHDRLVACFSGARDLSSQWEEYGRGGYALAFDAATLVELTSGNNYMLTDCIYDRAAHEAITAALIDDALDAYHKSIANGFDHDAAAMNAKLLFELPISTVMPRLKKEDLRSEAEYRLVSVIPLQGRPAPGLTHRRGKDEPIPYEPVAFRGEDGRSALREIMIAPGVDFEAARAELRNMLDQLGYSDVEVTASALA